MNRLLKNALAMAAVAIAAHATAQVTFYQDDDFRGQSFTAERDVDNFQRFGFNDRASSVVVQGERWEVCQDARFEGRCVVLRPGRYPSLSAMGLNDRVSSARAIGRDERAADNRVVPGPIVQDNARPGSRITFYEHDGFQGQAFTADRAIEDFGRVGFNDRASSIDVRGDNWVACEDARFAGRCVILQPGRYPELSSLGLNDRISSVRRADVNDRVGDYRSVPRPIVQDNARPGSQITFYEHDGFQGQAFTTDRAIEDFGRVGFNDRASSIDVRGDNWVACEDARFAGRCVILQPGRYPSVSALGLNDRISSVRRADINDRVSDNRNAPTGAYDYRRRGGEQTFEANVTSVRAVVGTPQQRCWVEREQISPNNTSANIPAALAGAVIGGILGHQIGGGGGRDAATALGVLGGAALGANVGRDSSGQQAYTQDVQRCDRPVGQVRPDYWDVTYVFRGREFHVQMVAPPGPTVTVNSEGEPRV
jgi:uncharacterized protein YcfJ/uncharacterized protein (UPF0179 family)